MDNVSAKVRSRIMAAVHSSGNKSTEIAFLRLLKNLKITGWRRKYPIYGKPDFAFPKLKIAVFIDGCFWHGCPNHCRMPKKNRTYWEQKICFNKKRDQIVAKSLLRLGWVAIRFWEHDISNPSICFKKIECAFAHPPLGAKKKTKRGAAREDKREEVRAAQTRITLR